MQALTEAPGVVRKSTRIFVTQEDVAVLLGCGKSKASVILKWVMVVLLWLIPTALIGFGVYQFWEKYGEDIRKGIDVWNCSVGAVILTGLVYFGDYVKEIVSVNLFGMWLLVDVLLILIGWCVWGCRKWRDWC